MKDINVNATLFVLLFFGFSIISHAQITGDSILINRSVDTDLYVAGRNIDVLTTVAGDLVGAGRRISVGGQISQDVIVAGETILIEATIQDDLRAAGRSINLSGVIDGHMVAAGQTVTISQDAVVGDWAWLAGETVDMTGTINGELRSAARSITIDGVIQGDVDLMGDSLRLGPRAVINGNVVWRSPNEIDISNGAIIRGNINEGDMPDDWRDHEDSNIGQTIFTIVSIAIGSIVIYLLLPGFSRKNAELLGAKPWSCVGSGLAVLVLVPVIILLLFITIIGYLPALALLMTYLTVLVIGLLSGIIAMGNFGLRIASKQEGATKTTWVLAILVAAIAAGLAWSIPFIGGLIFFLIWIAGIGITSLGVVNQFRSA